MSVIKKLIGFAFSPGHNNFWILYDVIKKGLLVPTSRKLVYYSSLSCSGFSPQLYSMKPCEIKGEE